MKRMLLLLSALIVGSALPAPAQKLVIKGSDTLGAKLVPLLYEEYRATHPGVSFEIAAEGSTTGIAAIIDGTADIGMSSRRATPIEMSNAQAKGVTLKPTMVAYDGIAIIVNEQNPISDLTARQVEQIFTGDVADWSAVGGAGGRISVYTRNTASGTYQDFRALAMKRRDYSRASQKMAGNEQIAAEVAANPNGIGYVGLAYIHAAGIKVVAIDDKRPTPQAVLDSTYIYSRPTFFYTNGTPTGEAAKFIEFTLSDAGKRVAANIGFVPPQ